MDRIKRLSMEVLNQHKDRFTADFAENKKALGELATIRSKGLKNEMAGYITKFVKREKDSKEELEEEIEETVEEEQVEEEQDEVAEESEVPQEITIESGEESG